MFGLRNQPLSLEAGQGGSASSATRPLKRSFAAGVSPDTAHVSPTIIACGKCPYCGSKNHEQAMHCHGCGTRLWVELAPNAQSLAVSEQPTPLHWLLRRRRSLQPILWLAAGVGFVQSGIFGIAGRFLGMGLAYGIFSVFGLAGTILTGALFAWAASRFFVEARRSGELELLLTTPIGAEAITSAQWDILKRQLWGPVMVMLLPLILQGFFGLSVGYFYGRGNTWWRFYYIAGLLLGGVNVVIGIGTLCWLGLWFGFRAATQGRAVVWTVALAKGPPYAVSLACALLSTAFARISGGLGLVRPWLLGSLAPQAATLVFYLCLIYVARRQLRHEISGAEPLPLSRVFSQGISTVVTRVNQIRHGQV